MSENEKDIIINNLRHLINNVMLIEDPEKWIGKANVMLDKYYLNGGKYLKSDFLNKI